jgi:hypothetical protein
MFLKTQRNSDYANITQIMIRYFRTAASTQYYPGFPKIMTDKQPQSDLVKFFAFLMTSSRP